MAGKAKKLYFCSRKTEIRLNTIQSSTYRPWLYAGILALLGPALLINLGELAFIDDEAIRALVALDFDVVVLEGATNTAFLLEGFGEVTHVLLGQCQAGYERNCLAATALGLAVQPDNNVTGCRRPVLAADTTCNWPMTLWAQAAALGGVDKGTVFTFVHGLVVSFASGEQYISLLAQQEQ